jgi:hypothetical protein
LGTLGLLAGSIGGVLAVLVKQEPAAYRNAAVPPGPVREQRSQEFITQFSELHNGFKEGPAWDSAFTQEQINSYLAEDFVRSNVAGMLLPEGVSEPRVAFDQDRICLAFRYGRDFWSTVISTEMRVWRAAQQPNVVAIELLGMRAGLLPVTSQWLLERISAGAQRQNIELSWYRHRGNPVAVLKFQADQLNPTLRFDCVGVQDGTLVIRGKYTD